MAERHLPCDLVRMALIAHQTIHVLPGSLTGLVGMAVVSVALVGFALFLPRGISVLACYAFDFPACCPSVSAQLLGN